MRNRRQRTNDRGEPVEAARTGRHNLGLNFGDVISDARVGLAAVGPNTNGMPGISEALRGQEPSEEIYAQAGAIAAEGCSPSTDNRGTADYKRHLADELTRRTLRAAVERIRAGVAGDQRNEGRNG